MAFEAVLFDFGGVYTASPFSAFETYAEEIGVSAETVLGLVFGPYDRDTDHAWHRLERGEISIRDARDAIMADARAEGIELDPVEVLTRMAGGDGPRTALVERTRALRDAGYRLGLVTNNAKEFGPAWKPVLPLDELFHAVVDSSEVGVRKPDPAIYLLALERVGGIAPERAVFVDDFAGNVAAARALGMQGILVGADPRSAIAELDAILARAPGT